MNEIEQINQELFLGEELPEKKEFEIRDIGSADWALSTIKQNEEKLTGQINYLDSIIQKATRMKKEIEEKREIENQFLISKLLEWTKESLVGQKKRSINLLNGTVGFRKTPEKVDIEDVQKSVDFCNSKDLPIEITWKFKATRKTALDVFSEIKDLLKIQETLKPEKKSIKEFFGSKQVDDAEFPGGKYSSGSDKFYIK